MLQIYVHPRCSESYHVYQLVTELGVPGVSFVNTELDPFLAISKGVFAVPAFEREGKVILQGWFTKEDLLSLLKEGKLTVPSKEVAFERLLRSVVSSFTVASAVYLTGDLSILAGSSQYLLSASGACFLDSTEEFLEYATWKLRETEITAIEEKLLRSIASNFIRDMYWLKGKIVSRSELESLGYNLFETWLAARASIGRVFVPHSYAWEGFRERIQRAWSYLLERAEEIGPKVREEQERIPEGWV